MPRHRAAHQAVPPRHRRQGAARQAAAAVHHLVRPDAGGARHRSRAGQGRPVQQVRPLREDQFPGAIEADPPRPVRPRGREVGQAQEDPQPGFPAREAQGTISCNQFTY